jgi:methylmalonyl-CoA mutase N-terminal domain/subunit
MQILMHEMGLCDTVDPLGGSYFIEAMTDEMERRIADIMKELDAHGGIVEGVAQGWVQAQINRQAYEREKKIRSGEIKKVGVNCFVEGEEQERDVELHPYREEEAGKQIERLCRIRKERNGLAVARSLDEVRRCAAAGKNVMPAVIDAVEAYATVGEISNALKDVFGTYQEPLRF